MTALTLLALAGCSTGAPTTATTPVTPSVATTTTETTDVTDKVKSAAGQQASKITNARVDGNAVIVRTTVVDPRGDKGSPAAQDAIAICEATVNALAPKSIRVEESDGTTFVIYRDTAFTGVPANTCGEV